MSRTSAMNVKKSPMSTHGRLGLGTPGSVNDHATTEEPICVLLVKRVKESSIG